VNTSVTAQGLLELHWWTDGLVKHYSLYERFENGQLALVDSMEQGPFDTALDVAQWAWRNLSRRVPPSAS